MSRPNTVTVDFGDGKERELRYSIASTKKLVAEFGEVTKILSMPFLEFLPILHGGLSVKDVTLAELEEIVTMPQAPYLVGKFIEAFTGKTVDQLSAEADTKNVQSSQTVQ